MSLINRLDNDDRVLSSFWTDENLNATPAFIAYNGSNTPKRGFVPAPPANATLRILATSGWILLGQANGIASLDSGGKIPVSQMPNSTIVTVASVANQTARYALTTASVQNGDHIRQTDNSTVWEVIDETNLGNSNGWAQLALTTWSTLDNKPDAVVKLGVKGSTVASASSVNFDTMTGDFCEISGTTTITGCTITAGVVRKVRFTGSLTINNSATILVPGAVNLKVGAGDVVEFTGDTGSVARVTSVMRANGAAPSTAPIYPGEAWVSTSGSDTLGVVGDPNRPFATPGGVPGATNGTTTLHLGDGTFTLGVTTSNSIVRIRGAGPGATTLTVGIALNISNIQLFDIGGHSLTLNIAGDVVGAPPPAESGSDGTPGLPAGTGIVVRSAYVGSADLPGQPGGGCGFAFGASTTTSGQGGAGGTISFHFCTVDVCRVNGQRGGNGEDADPAGGSFGGAGGASGVIQLFHSTLRAAYTEGGDGGEAGTNGVAGAKGLSATIEASMSTVSEIHDGSGFPGTTVVMRVADVSLDGGFATATGPGYFEGVWQDGTTIVPD